MAERRAVPEVLTHLQEAQEVLRRRNPNAQFLLIAYTETLDECELMVTSTYDARGQMRSLWMEAIARSLMADGCTEDMLGEAMSRLTEKDFGRHREPFRTRGRRIKRRE